MLRLGEDLRCGTVLDDATRVHHDDPVRDRRDDREIVRDVDDREAELALQQSNLTEQVRLRDDVEPGRRLVHQHDRGPADESCGDRDALLLSARQLVREAAAEVAGGRKLHELERLADALLSLRRAVDQVAHLVADPHRRVERGGRILRHVRDQPAAVPPDGALGEAREPRAGDLDRPGRDADAGPCVAEERKRGRRLAAA